MNQGEGHGQAAGTGAEAFTREETYAAARRPVSLAATLLPGAYTGHRSRLRRKPSRLMPPSHDTREP